LSIEESSVIDRPLDHMQDADVGLPQAPAEVIVVRRFVQQHDVDIMARAAKADRIGEENLVRAADGAKKVTPANRDLHNSSSVIGSRLGSAR
jgi:hypothetical protein